MEIKFETNGYLCLTECPFGKEHYGVGMSIDKTRVGSSACIECVNFVSVDLKNNIVICAADK